MTDDLNENAVTNDPSRDEPTAHGGADDAHESPTTEVSPAAPTAESPKSDTVPELDLSWMGFDTTSEGDIDAALAAVSSLGDRVREDGETETVDEDEPTGDEADDYADEYGYTHISVGVAARAADVALSGDLSRRSDADLRTDAGLRENKSAPERYTPRMAVPPTNITLKRGSLGSLIPALILIGVGGWLTLVTTSGGAVDGSVLAAVGVGGAALSMLGYWISSGRWSRGTVFFAVLVALAGGLLIFALVPSGSPLDFGIGIDLTRAYPLLVAAFGLAAIISGLLARSSVPNSRKAILPGVVLLTAGLVGVLVTLGFIPGDVLNFAASLWFVPLVALLMLWMLPLVFRLRERDRRR